MVELSELVDDAQAVFNTKLVTRGSFIDDVPALTTLTRSKCHH